MAAKLSAIQRQYLAPVAASWLARGASTFSLWDDDRLLACWPTDVTPEKVGVGTTVQLSPQVKGELYVTGCRSEVVARHLQVEAQLLTELFKCGDEIESLTAELVDTQDQLLALYKLTETTRSHVNLDQMLHLLLREAVRLVKAAGAFILLIDEDQISLVVKSHELGIGDEILYDFFRRVKVVGDELFLRDVKLSDTNQDKPIKVFLKLLPTHEGTETLFGLLLEQPTSALGPHLKLARAVADYADAQIENALLHKKTLEQAKLSTELELAARIQLQLLPQKPPIVSGLDLAAKSKPALKVGGDFFDFIGQSACPLSFVLGDVSGKGMSAALLMAMTRTVIRSRANLQPMPMPETILSVSNEIMYDDFTQVGMFCTVFIGHYDPNRAEIWYANAGHSPVIYCPAGGLARLLEADGPALGTLPISLSENQVVSFQPGDLLIIATDGFNESRNFQGELWGIQRMLALIEKISDQPAHVIAERLFEAVDHFSEGHAQDDDQTLIVIKGVD